jgi:hypothetical protein
MAKLLSYVEGINDYAVKNEGESRIHSTDNNIMLFF